MTDTIEKLKTKIQKLESDLAEVTYSLEDRMARVTSKTEACSHEQRLSTTTIVQINKEDDSVSWDSKTFAVTGTYTATSNLPNTLEAVAFEMARVKLSETYDGRELVIPSGFDPNYVTYYEVLNWLTNTDVMSVFGNRYGLGLVVEQDPKPNWSWRYFAPALRKDDWDDNYQPDMF
jgi:hypothetical protein